MLNDIICKKLFARKKLLFSCFETCSTLVCHLDWLEKKKIKLDLPKNYGTSQYIQRLPYIRNEDPNFQNSIIDIVNNRSDLKIFLLATGDYGRIFKKILTLLFQMENLIRLLYVELLIKKTKEFLNHLFLQA